MDPDPGLAPRVVAQPDRDLLLDPVAAAAQARHLHQRDRPRRAELAFIETYSQTAKPFKWTYTGKVLEA
jgi:hypothetical protein